MEGTETVSYMSMLPREGHKQTIGPFHFAEKAGKGGRTLKGGRWRL